MTDRYENIRRALALLDSGDYCERAIGYSKLRNACRPDTIRELLAERDQLAAALEAAREDVAKLRETLRTVSAVGIVQLFGTARDDVLAEFSTAELQEISRVTEHKRPEQVERIYREGWDAAIDQARGKEVLREAE